MPGAQVLGGGAAGCVTLPSRSSPGRRAGISVGKSVGSLTNNVPPDACASRDAAQPATLAIAPCPN